MGKGIGLGFCIASLAWAVSSAGCEGKEASVQENPVADGILKAGAAVGEGISDVLAEAASRYPVIAELPRDMDIDMVMYSEGCYCIYDGSFYGFVTVDGEEISPYIYEQASPFSEGLACVSLNGKYGYIGMDGETAIPFLYDQASPFSEGLAYYRIGQEYGFIDHQGQAVLRPDCDSVSSFQEGRAYFSVDGRYGYMDKTGEITEEPVYDDAGYYWDGLAKVMQNGHYGVIGMDGEEILPLEYVSVSMEEDFILAVRDGLTYCFDRAGKPCMEEGWDYAYVMNGLVVVERDDRLGLFDGDGRRILEPQYDWVKPIQGRELVIVEKGGLYGVTDYEGEEKVPLIYQWIADDYSGTGLQISVVEDSVGEDGEIVKTGRYGFLIFTEQGNFVEIPLIYDYIGSFVGDRAVVVSDGKYGVIQKDGELEIPLKYDRIRLFANGSIALTTGEETVLQDRNGTEIYSGWDIEITATAWGSGYQVKEGGKYGFRNARGELLVPMIYDAANSYQVFSTDPVLCMRQYKQNGRTLLLLLSDTDPEMEWMSESFRREVFLQNHITPRAEAYADFLQDGVFEGEEGYLVEMDGFHGYRAFSKLYRIGESGELILYFYSKPYISEGFPRSDSGFFAVRNGRVEQLIAGYECGGSLRGDRICLWYDEAKPRLGIGLMGDWGGFGGYAGGSYLYELKGGGAELSGSYYSVSQSAGNYSPEELLETPELFYDNENRPFTAETMAQAVEERMTVTEYQVDGKRTTMEHFWEVHGKYHTMNALDLWYE